MRGIFFFLGPEVLEKDPGSVEVVSAASLLDCICYSDGSLEGGGSTEDRGAHFTTQSPTLCLRQPEMAKVSRDLCCGDAMVYEALRSVSNFNATMDGLGADSTAFKVAAEPPDYYWKGIEERRKRTPGLGIGGYGEWMGRTPGLVDHARNVHDVVRNTYPVACQELNVEITTAEVATMLARLKDVGASLDNVSPSVMHLHAGHSECVR